MGEGFERISCREYNLSGVINSSMERASRISWWIIEVKPVPENVQSSFHYKSLPSLISDSSHASTAPSSNRTMMPSINSIPKPPPGGCCGWGETVSFSSVIKSVFPMVLLQIGGFRPPTQTRPDLGILKSDGAY